ncbi:MAG: hypothetical protein GY817_02255 [bacterium]|nr:hypothetical protein [bacterium]
MGLLENGNIRPGFHVKLVQDIANPSNKEQFNRALKQIDQLTIKSGGRLEWLAGPVATLMIKKNENFLLSKLAKQGIVTLCHRNIGMARKIDDKIVPAGTVILSAGKIGMNILDAIKANKSTFNEQEVADTLNSIFKFSANVYSAELGDLSKFETMLQKGETWQDRVDVLDLDISEFGMDKITFVKLMSMTRFIWGESGILAENIDSLMEEYKWFRQLSLRGKVVLPEIISQYSDKINATQVLKVNKKMPDGTVLIEYLDVIDRNPDNNELVVKDLVLKSAEIINIDNIYPVFIKELKKQLRLEKILINVWTISSIKVFFELFIQDKSEKSFSIEEYTRIARSA